MSFQTFYMEQGSAEWWAVRRGVPTASEFDRIITPAKGQLAAGHTGYVHQLIADLFDPNYGQLESEYASLAMRRGVAREPESRRFYEFERGVSVRQVGFCLTGDGRFGCSPDFLVGEEGCGELKNPDPKTHIAWLLGGVVPAEHVAQCHGHLVVSEYKWCDFVSYCPGMPSQLIVRVFPNEFTVKLRECLEQFWSNYQAALTRVKGMG